MPQTVCFNNLHKAEISLDLGYFIASVSEPFMLKV